jgi:hypothetical protein
VYQIGDLRQALAAVERQVEGLHVNIDLTGELMATAAGNMPTILYTVEFRGQE